MGIMGDAGMGKTGQKKRPRGNPARAFDLRAGDRKPFIEFKRVVEEEMDSAILKRLKTFTADVLNSKLK